MYINPRAQHGARSFLLTTFRTCASTHSTRDEVTNIRSTQDSIQGFRKRILEWGVLTEEEIKGLEKDTRLLVDKGVAEAEESLVPENTADVFKDIYLRTRR
jgi:pyruvate dehydrogenase E1 component alpha subunit